MKHIKKILFFTVFLTSFWVLGYEFHKLEIEMPQQSLKDQKTDVLPFGLQLSIDVIDLELKHYKSQFNDDWDTNPHAKIIIEEAEILVQTAPLEFQNKLKTKIIELFKKNDLLISFAADNTIIRTIDPIKTDLFWEKKRIKHSKLPKKHKHKKEAMIKGFQPKKIHGARRTIKRLKKEQEEAKKSALAEIKARIEAKRTAALKAQKEDLVRNETQIRNQILVEHAKIREEMLHKLEENLDTNLDTKKPNEEHL